MNRDETWHNITDTTQQLPLTVSYPQFEKDCSRIYSTKALNEHDFFSIHLYGTNRKWNILAQNTMAQTNNDILTKP